MCVDIYMLYIHMLYVIHICLMRKQKELQAVLAVFWNNCDTCVGLQEFQIDCKSGEIVSSPIDHVTAVTKKPVLWGDLLASGPALGQSPVACWFQGVITMVACQHDEAVPKVQLQDQALRGEQRISPRWSCKRLLNTLELPQHPA